MLEGFLTWFRAQGGTFDSEILEFAQFPESEGGRGIGARVNIPVRSTLTKVCAIVHADCHYYRKAARYLKSLEH
jgi:hypothetical protein